MLLAFDIGNTETTVGLFANDRLEATVAVILERVSLFFF